MSSSVPMSGGAWLEELSYEECRDRLRDETVGRIGIIIDGQPLVVPVNYRLVEPTGWTWVALRTRPGNIIDRAHTNVAFEIDGIDLIRREGFSVLVRGTLHRVDPDAASFRDRFDPEPWLVADRDRWVVIEPFSISGRRLHAAAHDWAFEPQAYI